MIDDTQRDFSKSTFRCKSSKADNGRDREEYTWNRSLGSSPKSFLVPLLNRSASESASRLPDRYADSMDGPDTCRQSREVKIYGIDENHRHRKLDEGDIISVLYLARWKRE